MADRFDELMTRARGGADGDVDALADALLAASARSAESRKEAVARAWLLLRARRSPAPPADSTDAVRRRYEIGRSPVVRDARSGRSSGNADRVLAGALELVM